MGASVSPWCAAAAAGGHLEILKFLVADCGVAPDTETCAKAAGNGHLQLLQWAHAHGCPWSAYSTCSAAEAGAFTRPLFSSTSAVLVSYTRPLFGLT
jgi:hypothetical protein